LKPNRKYEHLFAIIRHATKADEHMPLDLRFVVTKVVTDPSYAQQEVNRLNELNDGKGYYYFTQITRIEEFPVKAEPTPSVQMPALASKAADEGSPDTGASSASRAG
jgi:hypothetical protein